MQLRRDNEGCEEEYVVGTNHHHNNIITIEFESPSGKLQQIKAYIQILVEDTLYVDA